jgi:hypothetical protein
MPQCCGPGKAVLPPFWEQGRSHAEGLLSFAGEEGKEAAQETKIGKGAFLIMGGMQQKD